MLALAVRATDLHVRDFGAVGDGESDDGPALRRALQAAQEADAEDGGRTCLLLEPGARYRLGPWDRGWCVLPLSEARDLTIDGRGGQLLVHPKNRAFQLDNCERVTLRNLTVDYDPLPFTQGDVLSVDYEAKSFVLRLHDGYAEPPTMAWVRANGQTFDHGSFVEARPSSRFTHRWVYVESVTPVEGEDRAYRIQSGAATADQLTPTKVVSGQRFVFYLPHCTGAETEARNRTDDRGVWVSRLTASIQLYNCSRCEFENVAHYTSPRMTVYMDGCDQLAFRRMQIVRKPGTDRLCSSISDGLHGGCRRGPLVEDCTFDGMMDDSLGFHYVAHVVAETLSPTRFRLEYANIAWHDTWLRRGDTVQAWDPVEGRVLGERRIDQIEFVSSHVRIVTLDERLDGVRGHRKAFGGDPAARNKATQLYLKNDDPMVVRNCRFGTQLKEAVRVCYRSVVEDNTIVDTAYGVNAVNDAAWWSGPPARGLIWRRNRIAGAWPFAIGVQSLSLNPKMKPVRGDVLIEDNHLFVRVRGWESPLTAGITVANVDGVTLRGNTVSVADDVDPRVLPVHLRNCADVVLAGNTVRDMRQKPEVEPILLENTILSPESADPRKQLQAVAEASRGPSAGDPRIVRVLKDIREKHDIPGMAAGIVTLEKGLAGSAVVGVRKRGTAVAATLNDLGHLGSDTKAMTATLVARLVEDGRLQWDDTLEKLYPEIVSEIDPGFRSVSLLQILSHRAGFKGDLNWWGLSGAGGLVEQRIEALKQGAGAPPEYEPGTKGRYSNLSYVVAGAVTERVTGKTWEEAMEELVFEPLGMRTVGHGGTGTPGEIDQPWGHGADGQPVSGNGPTVDNAPSLGPAGRVHCSLQDWARFIHDVLRGASGEVGLLKPESYRVLHTPVDGGGMGLGWIVTERPWGGGTVMTHAGSNTMNYANVWVAPLRGFAILVCANQGGDAAARATDQAVGALIPYAAEAAAKGSASPSAD